jgi:glycosyltransferase involved in cell wall biosynthesis
MAVEYPLVSILIATQDRHRFIPYLLRCIYAQTYPSERTQLVVGDDGQQTSKKLFPPETLFIRYHTKVSIGKKRNDLKQAAAGEIMVTMDDDDYYFPTYLQHAVDTLTRSTTSGLATLVTSYVFYPGRWKLEIVGPRDTGWPGASFAFTRKYSETHNFGSDSRIGEETKFTDNFQVVPSILESCLTMIIISHRSNTCNKNQIKSRRSSDCSITDYIQDPDRINFYQLLGREINRTGPKLC